MRRLSKKIDKILVKLDKISENSSNYIAITSGIATILCILKDYIIQILPSNIQGFANISISILFGISICLLIGLYTLISMIKKEKIHFFEYAIKYKDLQEENETIKNILEYYSYELSKINLFSITLLNISEKIKAMLSKEKDLQTFKTDFDTIIKEIIFPKLRLIFGAEESDMFTIAVYLYNPVTNLIEDYSSIKDLNMQKQQKGRSWAIGDGHIGYSFDRKEMLIHSDIHEQMKPAPKNSKKDDKLYYNSAITIPIYVKETDNVRGVLCITSNKKCAFENIYNSEIDFLTTVSSIKITYINIITNLLSDLLNLAYGDDMNNHFPQINKQKH